jgi:hypothetical protein
MPRAVAEGGMVVYMRRNDNVHICILDLEFTLQRVFVLFGTHSDAHTQRRHDRPKLTVSAR